MNALKEKRAAAATTALGVIGISTNNRTSNNLKLKSALVKQIKQRILNIPVTDLLKEVDLSPADFEILKDPEKLEDRIEQIVERKLQEKRSGQ